MGQIKNIKLHIVTDIKVTAPDTTTKSRWLMYPRPVKHFAMGRNAENTLFTKSPSTRQQRKELLPKDKDVTNESRRVMEDRRDRSITRKQRPQRKLFYVSSVQSANSVNRWL